MWDAAVVMAKHMETNPKDYDPAKLAKKTVIELGSGCGLAGLAFLLRGAAVTFTDMQKVVESLTERNVMVCSSHLQYLLVTGY